MTKTFEQSKDEVVALSKYFDVNRDSFHKAGVKEAHIRQTLIDPLFEALDWDVGNKVRSAPQYREVIPEDSLEIEGHQKAPDYTFRIGTLPKFFVEAKKCGVNIKDNDRAAYQLRRYGFSARLPLCILTDFEELSIYDCTSRPNEKDKAAHSRLSYFRHTEYGDRWHELWDLFSRDSVWSGKFDQFAALKKKRGTSMVDDEFLKDIEGWREQLAHNIAKHNTSLNADGINTAVQRTIDRIIFLRMAEDRSLEPDGQLLRLCEQQGVYHRFVDVVCKKADAKYNSGLFHFSNEENTSELPDKLTPKLKVDDEVFGSILKGLYFEHGCPFHFGVLPVEILGTVYERFLGKVIRIDASGHAKIEEKPEVRKAGGVYYTPSYIVNYVVDQTVGRAIEGKSPQQLSNGKGDKHFRVLDMACGSGSFLLGAYQVLLEHCLKWYLAHQPEKFSKAMLQDSKGAWRLSISERKRILLSHIFGVDIDKQAVEVTKLSLLLKSLEGENDASLTRQLRIFEERALPNLADNIKCGNSLFNHDYSDDPTELIEINPFDWPNEFLEATKCGGFDVILGNPPWGATMVDRTRAYLAQKHSRVIQRMVDSYIYFTDRALQLTRTDGWIGYVIPATVLNQVDTVKLREILLQHGVTVAVNMGKDIFTKKVLNTTAIIVASGKKSSQVTVGDVSQIALEERPIALLKLKPTGLAPWKKLVTSSPDHAFVLGSSSQSSILSRLRKAHRTLSDFTEDGISRGVSPDYLEAHIITKNDPDVKCLERSVLKESIPGKSIKRYTKAEATQYLLYTHKGIDPKSIPNAIRHLTKWKSSNTCKEASQGKHPWWTLHRARDQAIFKSPKLIGLTTAKTIEIAIDECSDLVVTDAMYVFRMKNPRFNKVAMAIMHSKTFLFLYRTSNQGDSRVIPQIKAAKLEPLPFPDLDAVSIEIITKINSLVDRISVSYSHQRNSKSDNGASVIQSGINKIENEINALVDELYGLSSVETQEIEKSMA